MFKFEISADSPEELQLKMQDFAKDILPKSPVVPADFIVRDSAPMTSTHIMLPEYRNEPVEEITQNSSPIVMATNSVGVPSVNRSSDSQRDAKGLPWDARIHSSSKALNKDNTWRYKKGLDDGIKAQVEAQLRQLPAPNATPIAVPVVVPTIPIELPNFAPAAVQQAPIVQQPSLAVVSPAAAPAQAEPSKYDEVPIPKGQRPVHTLTTFGANLFAGQMLINTLINEGKITTEYLGTLTTHFKLDNFWDIIEPKNKSMLVDLYVAFKQAGFITDIEG